MGERRRRKDKRGMAGGIRLGKEERGRRKVGTVSYTVREKAKIGMKVGKAKRGRNERGMRAEKEKQERQLRREGGKVVKKEKEERLSERGRRTG